LTWIEKLDEELEHDDFELMSSSKSQSEDEKVEKVEDLELGLELSGDEMGEYAVGMEWGRSSALESAITDSMIITDNSSAFSSRNCSDSSGEVGTKMRGTEMGLGASSFFKAAAEEWTCPVLLIRTCIADNRGSKDERLGASSASVLEVVQMSIVHGSITESASGRYRTETVIASI